MEWQTEAVVTAWDDAGAHVRSYLDGAERVVAADTLVLATTNVPEASLAGVEIDAPVTMIGDALAARLAVHAIYDGRGRRHARVSASS